MKIPEKDLFTNNEVLLVGYSSDPSSFSRHVYNGFEDADIKVYAYNPKDSNYDIKVYNNYSLIPQIPEVAVALLNRDNLEKEIDKLTESGIKTIIINNKKSASEIVLSKCEKKGIEVKVLCPLLIVGSGFHKIHKFFAGLL